MIKLKHILSEVDYQSKLSKGHKPDWDQLHTSKFKPFNDKDVDEARGELKPGGWTELSGKALDKFKEELSDLISIADKQSMSSSDIKDKDGYKFMAVNTDKDGAPDAIKIYKQTDGEKVVVAVGHDGSKAAMQKLYTMKDLQKGMNDQDEGILGALKVIIKKIF